MTLQVRLTLIYAGLAIAAVAILGIAVFLIVSDRLHSNVDRSLEAEIRAVEAGLVGITTPITASGIEVARLSLDRQAVDGSVFQLRSADGAVLLSSDGLAAPLPFTTTGPPEPGFATLEADLRTLTRPVVRAGQTVAFVETRNSLHM